MLVPSFMKEDKEVRPGSPFQYANRYRNLYSTVFFDKKEAVGQTIEQFYPFANSNHQKCIGKANGN
jgi:hypothetical protein